MNSSVCVIITCWNQIDKTMPCVASVYEQTHTNLQVLIIDNGSTDNTVEQISTTYPSAKIISLPTNLGPTGGYNVGFKYALEHDFTYIFLLNNDTTLAPNCIESLVAEVQSSDDIGMVMPKIYYDEDPNRIWSIGNSINPINLEIKALAENELDTGQWSEATDIDDAPFCAVLFKRGVFETVGLPDEDYFLYYEDMDFCLRARRHGFRIRTVPTATMWHIISASSGGTNNTMERYWKARSSILYFHKNAAGKQWLAIFPWRIASAIRTSFRLVRLRKYASLRAHLQGLFDGLRNIPTLQNK